MYTSVFCALSLSLFRSLSLSWHKIPTDGWAKLVSKTLNGIMDLMNSVLPLPFNLSQRLSFGKWEKPIISIQFYRHSYFRSLSSCLRYIFHGNVIKLLVRWKIHQSPKRMQNCTALIEYSMWELEFGGALISNAIQSDYNVIWNVRWRSFDPCH